MEFTETFQALHPEGELGNWLVDLFPQCIVWHLALRPSDDRYEDYVKNLDRVLHAVHVDPVGIYMAPDASAPTKVAVQAVLASLVYRGNTKVHIVVAGGRATHIAKLHCTE